MVERYDVLKGLRICSCVRFVTSASSSLQQILSRQSSEAIRNLYSEPNVRAFETNHRQQRELHKVQHALIPYLVTICRSIIDKSFLRLLLCCFRLPMTKPLEKA